MSSPSPCPVSRMLAGMKCWAMGSGRGRLLSGAGFMIIFHRHCLFSSSAWSLDRRLWQQDQAAATHAVAAAGGMPPHAHRRRERSGRKGHSHSTHVPATHVALLTLPIVYWHSKLSLPCAFQVCGGNAGDLRCLAAEIDSRKGNWDAGGQSCRIRAATLQSA